MTDTLHNILHIVYFEAHEFRCMICLLQIEYLYMTVNPCDIQLPSILKKKKIINTEFNFGPGAIRLGWAQFWSKPHFVVNI